MLMTDGLDTDMTTIQSPLSITIKHTDRWVVHLSGELDAAGAPELRSLARALEICRDNVDFDVSHVTFMDGRGWAGVRAAARAVEASGCTARIVNPSPAVKRLTDAVARSRAAYLTAVPGLAPAA